MVPFWPARAPIANSPCSEEPGPLLKCLSYEVFIGLSLLGIFMVYESTQISVIVDGQNTYWFGDLIPKWGIFTQPLGFVLFFVAMIAETKTRAI